MNHTVHRSSTVAIAIAIATLLLGAAVCTPAPAEAAKEPKKRVAVTGFENRSGVHTVEGQTIGSGLAELLISGLIESDKFIVLERMALNDVLEEQGLGRGIPTRPDTSGRLTAAQIIVRGTITSIEHEDSAGGKVSFRGMRIGRDKVSTRIGINLRLMDSVTGQVVFSRMLHGEATSSSFGIGGGLRGVGGEVKKKKSGSFGIALESLVNQAVDSVIEGMGSVPWQGTVVKVSGRDVYVNAGRQENVEPGMRLMVLARGQELIDPETNESLGREDEEIGLIEITRIGDRFSIGRVLQGQGFRKGNVVRPEPESLSDLGVSLAPAR